METRKISRRHQRSVDDAEQWSFHVGILQRMAKKRTKISNARASGDVLVAATIGVV